MRSDHNHRHSITIIGGGFAGTLTAIKLLDAATQPLDITIVERRADLRRGVAYSTTEAVHLVNGPANIFSLHPDDPEHLARWLTGNGAANGWQPPEDVAASTPPRYLFGTYVRDELTRGIADARERCTFRHIRSSATSLRSAANHVRVTLANGDAIEADEMVLALGVFQAGLSAHEAPVSGHPAFAANPWDSAALDRLADGKDILVIGSSLSMVDAVASMEARGYRGSYQVISRRGQFVESRRDAEPARDFLADRPLPATARSLFSLVKAERRAIAKAGADWQGLPLAIRPYILPLWQKASDRERLRFTRHLRAFWDVTAHRSAPDTHAAIERAIGEARLSHRAARLIELASDGDRILATIRTRCGVEALTFDGIIDCRGHQLHDWRRTADPFVQSLLAAGEVRPHSTGFGIDATTDGALISRDGHVHRNLSAIGHPLRGVAWESSSITEQRAGDHACRSHPGKNNAFGTVAS
ncbi:FAD/NAD(P)-binding protein (plasmid) [Rhizobium sp. RCAM05350]|nr:FAD/NAD(P)-binding protein [Rhizobium sp. RCAM05350]